MYDKIQITAEQAKDMLIEYHPKAQIEGIIINWKNNEYIKETRLERARKLKVDNFSQTSPEAIIIFNLLEEEIKYLNNIITELKNKTKGEA